MDANQITRNDTPKSIFNPLREDFTVSYLDENNKPRDYTIRSMEIETFPTYLADHIIKHLITAVQDERSLNLTNTKLIEEIRKEIEVNGL
jgi:hypothetical protein